MIANWPYEYPYVDTMFLQLLDPFPLQSLPFIFCYHLFHYEGYAFHMLDINKIIFQLWH
jgi:hypothetical protein